MGIFDKKKKTTYYIEYDCHNCGQYDSSDVVPLGVTSEEFLKGKKCFECECLVLGGLKNEKHEEE